MEKTSITTVGGVVTAVFASLCCIGPVLVALLGIGSIGAFAVFESYRWYLIAATVLLLGLAFLLVYRKREVKCKDGTCRVEDAGRWNKVGVWGAAFISVFAIAFPYLEIAPSSGVHASVSGNTAVVLAIEGMDCAACAKGLEGSLAGMDGVHKAVVEFEQGKAIVQYDASVVQPEALVNRVTENGFHARISEHLKGEENELLLRPTR